MGGGGVGDTRACRAPSPPTLGRAGGSTLSPKPRDLTTSAAARPFPPAPPVPRCACLALTSLHPPLHRPPTHRPLPVVVQPAARDHRRGSVLYPAAVRCAPRRAPGDRAVVLAGVWGDGSCTERLQRGIIGGSKGATHRARRTLRYLLCTLAGGQGKQKKKSTLKGGSGYDTCRCAPSPAPQRRTPRSSPMQRGLCAVAPLPTP